MTAHAMKGDRERCLEAGMDGYTSKPIRIKELQQTISELTPMTSPKKPVGKQSKARTAIDDAALLEGFGGSRSLLKKTARLFLSDYPRRLEEIKQSIGRGDSTALTKAAHALKGSVGNFAANEAFATAQQLENMGKNGQLDIAAEKCIALESELALVAKELRTLSAASSRALARPRKRGSRQARKLT
jgi:HPt (histidine-containing phosphotransfer) domain-containing protein